MRPTSRGSPRALRFPPRACPSWWRFFLPRLFLGRVGRGLRDASQKPRSWSLVVRRRVCPEVLRPSGAFAPTGLGPELVPGIEVLEVLPTVSHLAVLELEDDAVGNIEVLAVSVRGAALDADDAVITICSHVL